MGTSYQSPLTESENVVTQVAEAQARRDYAQTPEGQRKANLRRYLNMFGVASSAAAVFAVILGPFAFQWPGRITGAVAASCLFLAAFLPFVGYRTYEKGLGAWNPRARAEALQDLQAKKEKFLAESSLEALLIFNREDMYRYHDIATTVARRASRLSAFAMTVGFLVLVAGAISVVIIQNNTSKIVIAALTALGGLFSGYITKTFFTAEEKAVNQLYKYWQQPREASYLLAAERVARELNDPAKERAYTDVITKALSIVLIKEQLDLEADNVAGNGALTSKPRTRRPRGSTRVQPNNPPAQPNGQGSAAADTA
ncbi:TRADD-N-associated membrane domain-containing protein [Geodermatophilus obscurus]|uniref:Cyanobacterial TRADD-N associated 2 transmembrane domain-containing protein n=1 Tax=Geodermatophilus obscurus (strain ATCC 25078 / DSM 43160 / JCM 3152 / CCUG 61914 / KCC A-0152 / KCTC 9177 / NBRC 13315 / NRRL B-3577 / G-20) TaxID=526225 RepID=D2SBR3_GEOOG|nr:hypothetical protein [Geodermatophilus obscurus]ADB76170.1 hypothetical protein Gobs_3582 [Geodermatophilus obscurus DSM 43160]